MTAAELNFPNPPQKQPQWIELAQAVFAEQQERWNDGSCGGGIRWQIHPVVRGWDYKNAISNALFFQLASRLGLYTGEKRYKEWADKVWAWMEKTTMVTQEFDIWDGFYAGNGCADINHVQWSPNYAALLMGAVYMYDQVRAAPVRI